MNRKYGLGLIVGMLTLSGIGFSESAEAAAISGQLFNTGVDNAGNALAPNNATDPHYTVVENGNAQAITYYNPGYVPNDANSAWIWENGNGLPTNVIRTFQTTFDLTGYDPATAAINGLWGADNLGLDILINGVSTGNTSPGFFSLVSFSINSGFVQGLNTLRFVVSDVGTVGAFRVDEVTLTADEATAVPTPALLPGLIGMGVVTLRKRKQEADAEA